MVSKQAQKPDELLCAFVSLKKPLHGQGCSEGGGKNWRGGDAAAVRDEF
jgi:hypothetical protein